MAKYVELLGSVNIEVGARGDSRRYLEVDSLAGTVLQVKSLSSRGVVAFRFRSSEGGCVRVSPNRGIIAPSEVRSIVVTAIREGNGRDVGQTLASEPRITLLQLQTIILSDEMEMILAESGGKTVKDLWGRIDKGDFGSLSMQNLTLRVNVIRQIQQQKEGSSNHMEEVKGKGQGKEHRGCQSEGGSSTSKDQWIGETEHDETSTQRPGYREGQHDGILRRDDLAILLPRLCTVCRGNVEEWYGSGRRMARMGGASTEQEEKRGCSPRPSTTNTSNLPQVGGVPHLSWILAVVSLLIGILFGQLLIPNFF